jgi:integrase
VSSLETRRSPRTGVTSYRVRYRDGALNRAETFTTPERARAWMALLEIAGPERARAELAAEVALPERTVGQQVAHHIEHLTGVTAGTRSDYRSYLAQDIPPDLADLPLTRLTRDDVARWVNALAARPLASKSIRNRHSLLSAALSSAQRDRLIEGNPCKGMRLPRTDHHRAEMVMLTRAEVTALLAAIPEQYRPLIVMLVATGIRWGEATALMAGDVDLIARSARIRQAWKHTNGKGHELGPPKSSRSLRTVTLEPGVRAVLAPLVAGRPANAFVFTNAQGNPVRQSNFHEQIWTPAVHVLAGDTRVEVRTRASGRAGHRWELGDGKRPRVHDLRHTYASWAIAANVPMTAIQRSMGHESITTTIDLYGHLQQAEFEVLARATSPLLGLD